MCYETTITVLWNHNNCVWNTYLSPSSVLKCKLIPLWSESLRSIPRVFLVVSFVDPYPSVLCRANILNTADLGSGIFITFFITLHVTSLNFLTIAPLTWRYLRKHCYKIHTCTSAYLVDVSRKILIYYSWCAGIRSEGKCYFSFKCSLYDQWL